MQESHDLLPVPASVPQSPWVATCLPTLDEGPLLVPRASADDLHRMPQMPSREPAVPVERSAPLRLPPHPAAPRNWRRWALQQTRPRAIDLFAGCGGLSLGLEQAGYTVIVSVDNDPWARETHRHNLPGPCLDLDLSNAERVDSLIQLLDGIPIDLVAGGPPCQPFSRAGRAKIRSLVDEGVRSATDERRELWQAFVDIVERVRPAAVLMENVPGMALEDDVLILRVMTRRLESAGYDVEARLLDAWRYGVPQHRQRLILLARRDGRPIVWSKDQKLVTLKDAIGDMPRLKDGTGRSEMKAGRPVTPFQRKARAGMNGHAVIWDHVTRPVRDDDREAFRLMKPGTRYGDLPEHLKRYRDDIFDDKYNRLDWNSVSRSITAHIAKDGYWYIHPSELRTLSVREAARIQTFPDRFRFAGSRSHAFRQIGNAVPPAMGETVGRALLSVSRRAPLPYPERPGSWLESARTALVDWGKRDSKNSPWLYPGDTWKVVVGTLLGDRTGGKDEGVRQFLAEFPSPRRGLSAAIKKAAHSKDQRTRSAWNRAVKVAAVLPSARVVETADRWLGQAGLGAAEELVVRVIALGEPSILTSTPLLRAVGRITDTRAADERRGSEGRLVAARIVGIGADAYFISAALHSLGRSVCVSGTPHCTGCPVQRLCKTARPAVKRRQK